ncbi:hypothetical protein BASA61_002968 [Batrachochytrium salamandrivorans]|nr:hypothetical protein BASA61_002968 [Batrachochytrium salamandrivorans]
MDLVWHRPFSQSLYVAQQRAWLKHLNLAARLAARTVVDPSDFDKVMQLREDVHNARDYTPQGLVDETHFFSGSFYLDSMTKSIDAYTSDLCYNLSSLFSLRLAFIVFIMDY